MAVRGLLCAFILFAVAGHLPANAKPVALVIANSNYQSVVRLPNPVNDAILARRVFEAYDFDVDILKDGSAEDMRAALADFTRKSENAEMAVIYYAGHGVQANNVNYLLPVDATASDRQALSRSSVAMAELFEAFSTTSIVKLLFMDACRDNPFEAGGSDNAGLARANHEVSDLLVMYSAQPNRVALDGDGSNSPFIQAIAETLAANSAVQLNDALIDITNHVRTRTLDQQLPYIEGSLSLHVKLARGSEIDTDISSQVSQCDTVAQNVVFAPSEEPDLDLEKRTKTLVLATAQDDRIHVCPHNNKLRVEGLFLAEFSLDQLLEAENEGIGYYFANDGAPAHLWLTVDRNNPDATVEIGLYESGKELKWITTSWQLSR